MSVNDSGVNDSAFYLLAIIVFEQLTSNLLVAVFSTPVTWHQFQIFLLVYAFKDAVFASLLSMQNCTSSRLYLSTLVASASLSVFCSGMINYYHNDLAHLLDGYGSVLIVTAQLLVVIYIIRRKYGRARRH